jgi:glycosyltransferase involved in cell wall biosynthesis
MRVLALSNCFAVPHQGSGYVIDGFARQLGSVGIDYTLLDPAAFMPGRNGGRGVSYLHVWAMAREIWRRRREHYDVIEFWGGEAWLAIALARVQSRVRPLLVQHTNGPEMRYNRILREVGAIRSSLVQRFHNEHVMKRAFADVDGIITVSEYDRAWLEQQGYPRTGWRQAIEIPLLDCMQAPSRTGAERRTIGFCGTWLPKKGIGVVRAELPRILRQFPDWRFIILGASTQRDLLSEFPEDVRRQIEVRPMIADKTQLAREYAGLDIFVLPSLVESFGIAIAEALAAGCAVVTTRVGLGASLLDGEEALLISGAEGALHAAVENLIADPALRQRLGRGGQARVRNLQWDTAVRTLADTYRSWRARQTQACQ